MTFAQFTYRERMRDIEVCLAAQASKLYRMGFASRIAARRWPMPTGAARLAHPWRVCPMSGVSAIAEER